MDDQVNLFFSFVPLLTLGALMAIPAGLLARDKGRNVGLWVVLALIPIVNFACLWYFVGTPDKRVERKLDQLLAQQRLSE